MYKMTAATRYRWQSDPLTDGQEYRFLVRGVTAPWPDGVESQNADERASTADLSGPATPTLGATVI